MPKIDLPKPEKKEKHKRSPMLARKQGTTCKRVEQQDR